MNVNLNIIPIELIIRFFGVIMLSSMALYIANLAPKINASEKWYFNNYFIMLVASFGFSMLLADFSYGIRLNIVEVIFMMFFSFLFAKYKGQEFVNKSLDAIFKRGSKILDQEAEK